MEVEHHVRPQLRSKRLYILPSAAFAGSFGVARFRRGCDASSSEGEAGEAFFFFHVLDASLSACLYDMFPFAYTAFTC